jgi:hypothetical protein
VVELSSQLGDSSIPEQMSFQTGLAGRMSRCFEHLLIHKGALRADTCLFASWDWLPGDSTVNCASASISQEKQKKMDPRKAYYSIREDGTMIRVNRMAGILGDQVMVVHIPWFRRCLNDSWGRRFTKPKGKSAARNIWGFCAVFCLFRWRGIWARPEVLQHPAIAFNEDSTHSLFSEWNSRWAVCN